ncbi:hypothetical protein A3B32_03495 [Candidatus Uhrbacteria bacterium RIFCSPLOWO2_01_FULL_53_9]|uniref:EamA domain-containing protein n=1 Tax=Candidatus Uhrbacteria bacterium RIFCSPLOWO2_01_FULL_53_9 TaxID=1802403 RepID=A0A1F7UYR1_9BACT|nr:MAG: hypothetical protein A3B32_03495 [Candidatus Uhrbacteria bacterium RIFCSPLOWO2_01_FULL_53_9]
MFVSAAVIGWVTTALVGHPFMGLTAFGAIALMGCVNAGAAYCQWRAVEISQSRTAVFTWADDLIAMGLGYAILSEQRYLTPTLVLGVVICVGCAVAMAFHKRAGSDEKSSRASPFALLGWVAAYSVIWGVAALVMRIYGLRATSIFWFATAWYPGAVLGALVIRYTSSEKEQGEPLTLKGLAGVFVLSTTIWAALALKYWASMLAPITVTQPVFQVSELVFPVLVGLFIFKEHQTLSHQGKLLLALATAGGIVIAFSY